MLIKSAMRAQMPCDFLQEYEYRAELTMVLRPIGPELEQDTTIDNPSRPKSLAELSITHAFSSNVYMRQNPLLQERQWMNPYAE